MVFDTTGNRRACGGPASATTNPTRCLLFETRYHVFQLFSWDDCRCALRRFYSRSMSAQHLTRRHTTFSPTPQAAEIQPFDGIRWERDRTVVLRYPFVGKVNVQLCEASPLKLSSLAHAGVGKLCVQVAWCTYTDMQSICRYAYSVKCFLFCSHATATTTAATTAVSCIHERTSAFP